MSRYWYTSVVSRRESIILHDVLHVPSLCCPLISVRCFRRLNGCSFLSDNSGCFLTFPTFFLTDVDDSSDCIIKGQKLKHSTTPAFDSRLIGSVSAVSNNTRHCSLRRPISTTVTTSKKKTLSTITQNHPVPAPSLPLEASEHHSSLSSIPKDSNLQLSSPSRIIPCNIDNQNEPSTILSPKQVYEILHKVTKHLETHGQITPELLNLLDMDKPSIKSLYFNNHTIKLSHPIIK
jgi:hypothetical protein